MPPQGYDRPGWLRMEQFGAGMITGWGAHHVDSAHWAMDTEYIGPVEVWGTAEFPQYTAAKPGLWDVHGKFLTHAIYANGVTMDISGDFPNGIKFYGTKGWLFVTRTEQTTPTDPGGHPVGGPKATGLEASDPRILSSVIGPDDVHLYKSTDQHGNWLDCILSRQAPISPSKRVTVPAPPALSTTSRCTRKANIYTGIRSTSASQTTQPPMPAFPPPTISLHLQRLSCRRSRCIRGDLRIESRRHHVQESWPRG